MPWVYRFLCVVLVGAFACCEGGWAPVDGRPPNHRHTASLTEMRNRFAQCLRRRKKVIAHSNAQYLFTKAKALIAQTTGAQ